ncbi:HNH endonuclease [Massilia cellulosiltytica]|uniref:HNH endonuclease n=1 Tax=Massilia cellulosiltytica TaxID=2683234 RepID=UPI0039B5802D
MALPRFVEEKLKAYSYRARDILIIDALSTGAVYGPRVFEIFNKGKNATASDGVLLHVTRCFIRSRWAYWAFKQFRQNCPDNMDRQPAELYVGLTQTPSGSLVCERRSVTIPIYFSERLEKLNMERETRDRADAKLVAKIVLMRNKIYVSRCFPSQLRLIIFERDKYCCQVCLRNKETLLKLGRHLEVDHILPVIDGGKTTYSNGMTICNECNIAKHHTKGYLSGISRH